MRFLYLDNNVFRIYCKKSWSDFENLVNPIFQARILDKNFNFQSSPYTILEAIGIRPTVQDVRIPDRFKTRLETFKKEEKQEELEKEVQAVQLYLFKEYKKSFYQDRKLNPKKIYRQYQNARSLYVVPSGLKLFDSIVTNNLTGKFKNYCNHLYSWYAFERTLSQNYPKAQERDFLAFNMSLFLAFNKGNYPNSFTKIFYSVARDLFNETKIKDKEFIRKRIAVCREARISGLNSKKSRRKTAQLRDAIAKVRTRRKSMRYVLEKSKFGGQRDTVDSEMIHYLVFGSNGAREPLIALSTDLTEVIVCRISIYKSVINAINEHWDGNVQYSKTQGIFFNCHKSSFLLNEFIEVFKIPGFFTFMNQGQDFESFIQKTIVKV